MVMMTMMIEGESIISLRVAYVLRMMVMMNTIYTVYSKL